MHTRTTGPLKKVALLGLFLLSLSIVVLGAMLAHAGDCDNGGQAQNCTVPFTEVPLPVGGTLNVGPINANGNASCFGDSCGVNGVGPVAVNGDSTCNGGCGFQGVGPIAVLGNAHCSTGFGCGAEGVGPIAVGGSTTCSGSCGGLAGVGGAAIGGNVTCSGDCGTEGVAPVAIGGNVDCSGGCGWIGVGPVAIGGNANCNATDPRGFGCGYIGTGPVGTGDVSCHGVCGQKANLTCIGTCVDLPRSGTPGISIAGHADCDTKFDLSKATNPATAQDHLQQFQCVSLREVAGV